LLKQLRYNQFSAMSDTSSMLNLFNDQGAGNIVRIGKYNDIHKRSERNHT
jgi:hypothetical protein